jgi:uncharacterized protein
MTESMAKAEEILAVSRDRGFLSKQLYVIFTTPTGGIAPVLEHLQSHLDYQQQLERRGIMFAAGPNWTDDEKSWEGEGMVVVRAGSLAEAEAIARNDPMHVSGARRYRVRPWLVNEGTLSVRLDFSTGRFQLA